MYQERIQKVRDLLEEKQLDAMIVSSISNIFYLTGISHFSKEEREAYLLITKHSAHFFTTPLYMEEVQKQTAGFTYHAIGRDMPFVKLFKQICVEEQLTSAGFEEHDIRYFEYYWMSKVLTALTPLSLEIRAVKDLDEIDKIRRACEMGDKAFAHAIKQIHEGISEKDIAIEIELFLKKNNSDISFRSIVAFGANSSMPHHEVGNQRLKQGDTVLIDMGAKVDGYCSDMTRTVFFGKPSDEAKKIYETVLESQKKAVEYMEACLKKRHPESISGSRRDADPATAGQHDNFKAQHNGEKSQDDNVIVAREVDAVARDYIISQGYPSIPHSLGHGTGIDLHEPPRLNPNSEAKLTEGMVFSIEPGIYLPDFMGVRIEDLFVIENNKLRILTLSPKELFVL